MIRRLTLISLEEYSPRSLTISSSFGTYVLIPQSFLSHTFISSSTVYSFLSLRVTVVGFAPFGSNPIVHSTPPVVAPLLEYTPFKFVTADFLPVPLDVSQVSDSTPQLDEHWSRRHPAHILVSNMDEAAVRGRAAFLRQILPNDVKYCRFCPSPTG